MSHVLMYSRSGEKSVNSSIEILCQKLNEIGHNIEHTHSANWARILLNPYDLIHLFIESLPMNVNELFFLSLAKTLGKPTLLSIFNSKAKLTKPLSSLVCPDAMTLSQTNHFQYYRDWICSKSLLPLFPELKTQVPTGSRGSRNLKNRSYLIPIETELEEAFLFKTEKEIYFDARNLLKKHSSTQLRKKWTQYLRDHKIQPLFHLILSDEKLNELLTDESLQIILASPHLNHTEFTLWLEKTLNRNHLIYLNEFQATSFSQTWTSGHNCFVLASHHWPKSFNQFLAADVETADMISRFKSSELVEPLINELSRLYTKILHQKTTLISSGSVKMKS